MNKITMQNVSSGTIIISVPNINFRRELVPGRSVPLTKEQYDELMFDPGVDSLMRGHYLKFEGVEEEEAPVVIDNNEVFSATQIAQMLANNDVAAFAKFIPTAEDAEKETVVKLAVEKGITNPAIVGLIKKYCGVDVIEAINLHHQLTE